MTSFVLPPGKAIPLVDEDSKLFNEPTMMALDARYAGGGGSGVGYEYVQSTPLATWTIPVPIGMGRRPNVDVYIAGELIDSDVTASSTQVVITFPSPQSGTAVLS